MTKDMAIKMGFKSTVRGNSFVERVVDYISRLERKMAIMEAHEVGSAREFPRSSLHAFNMIEYIGGMQCALS